jgi:hypothetical protein
VRWRYYEGACLIGVGSGASIIGEKAFRFESPFKVRKTPSWPRSWANLSLS